MTWLSTNSVPLLFLLVIAGLGSWGAYTQQRAERLLQDNQQLTRQRDTAQFILGNQQRAMTLFNAIAEATHEEKSQNTQHMETVRVIVRQELEAVPAAAVRVPAAVADRVRNAAADIRGAPADRRKP
ncbi:TPA: hypothetical protein JD344_20240 [Serratia marcescens]|uniref:hypothetical protein n=1 Tax=Serratia TaxID=613 RepID=UPI001A23D45D|nr:MULTISPECIES: hypothetical protein [Serratia]EMB4112093.1 hypothetical protein [Serratia marcescens]MDP8611941.1 hypothetical protein [Serratia marcescens]MDP8647216.1 hypothetical protein [Serratia marcescens]MDP8681531.1 hypothetical protein [Serratia marcescens]MDP8833296.1 hypothetical protein [Serratia marcescens]